MQALWLTSTYPWQDQPYGGVFIRTQSRAVTRAGAEVVVCCPTPWAPWPLRSLNDRWRLHARAPRLQHDEGVTILRPRYPNVPGEPSFAQPDRFIARSAWGTRDTWRSADIVHGHLSTTGLAAWRVSMRADLPLVLTYHGSDINTWPEEHPDRLPDIRAAAARAGAIIAVSGALATRAEAVTGRPAIHLPIGCDHALLDRLARSREAARDELGLPQDRTIVLYVGNLLEAKGVRELAAAIGALEDPFLGVMVGEGPLHGHGTDAARGRLQYQGSVAHDRIPVYMSAADVLVLPSYREGLPTVLVEAGSLGLPIIASAVGGIPELLADGRGTLLPEVTPAAIGDALTRFARQRDDAAQAAARLHAYVREAYDVDRNAARLLAIYDALIRGDAPT